MKLLSISIGIVNQEYRPLSQVNFVRKQIQMRHHFITILTLRFQDMLGIKRVLIEEHLLWNWNQKLKINKMDSTMNNSINDKLHI